MSWLKTFAQNAESFITRGSRILNVIGVIALGVLMLLITADVVAGFVFNHPITGTIDIAQYVLVIAVYCSVAYCAVVKGHVAIDLLVSRFSQRGQAITYSVTGFISLALFSLIAWRAVGMIMYSQSIGEASHAVVIAAWPIRTVLLIGILMLCLVLLTQIVHQVARAINR